MALNLTGLTISPESIEMTPSFSSSTLEYKVKITNVNEITINALTMLDNKIGFVREEDNKKWISENPGNFSITTNLLGGKNTFYISVQTTTIPIKAITYKLTINYSSGSITWPIYESNLKPGFYGGSYIPNFRLLKELYTCGSGQWDFEGDYNLKKELNEEAIGYLDEVVGLFTRVGKLNAIVESFVHYSGFVNTNWPDDGDYRYYLPLIEVGIDRVNYMRNKYIPKNNKLYSYPYSALRIIGYGGQSELKYELFPEDIRFGIVSKFLAGASIQLYPINYEGILDAYSEGVTSQPLPVFPYTKDEYMNEWNANINTRTQTINAMDQNRKLGIATNVLGGVTSALQGGFSSAAAGKMAGGSGGSVVGAIGGVASSVVQSGLGIASVQLEYNQGMKAMAASLKDTEARPSSIANQNASPSIPAVMKDAVVPFIQRVSIREVFAKKIDNFFTRYGYKVNKMRIPNIKSRPAFNFLKCTDAHVAGNIPNEDLLIIKSVLEHGVTFWHTPDVGNYELDNPAPIRDNPRYCKPVG